MQMIQQPDQPTDPDLAALQRIEELLVDIDRKLGFLVGVTILAIIWSLLT